MPCRVRHLAGVIAMAPSCATGSPYMSQSTDSNLSLIFADVGAGRACLWTARPLCCLEVTPVCLKRPLSGGRSCT
jgi:hypothetical protein